MSGTPSGNKIPTHKLCVTCKADLPRSAYNYRKLVSGTVTLESSCKECHKHTAKASRERKKLERSTALAKVNPERRAKRRKRYANYLRTKVWREKRQAALERAGYRCEGIIRPETLPSSVTGYSLVAPAGISIGVRCFVTDNLHVHHTTYARFGGEELPEDLQVLCKRCHAIEEAKHPTRHHQHRSYK